MALGITGNDNREVMDEDEIISLVKYNKLNSDFERAIFYLDVLKKRTHKDDIRRKLIQNEIDSLKIKQLEF